MKALIKDLLPPLAFRALSRAKQKVFGSRVLAIRGKQDLDVYWDKKMAHLLEVWGEGNVWNEIQFLMANLEGPTLDIACGTGKVIEILRAFPGLEVHGCDISDMLIAKAVERGIAADRVRVCDATKLPYASDQFDYSYSIGSLEHFTEDGLDKAIGEAARVTRLGSFHMVPTSRSGRDEGWMKTYQSFHNCSVNWWVERYSRHFGVVRVLDSTWNDQISVGKWFICSRRP